LDEGKEVAVSNTPGEEKVEKEKASLCIAISRALRAHRHWVVVQKENRELGKDTMLEQKRGEKKHPLEGEKDTRIITPRRDV